MNKIVARFVDGRVLKGMTADFSPEKDVFHVSPVGAPAGADLAEVHASELKALFFVKDFEGDPDYHERKGFGPLHTPAGRRIRVVFGDGEILVGTTMGYKPGRRGFFLEPADPSWNNERCYVVAAATEEVGFI